METLETKFAEKNERFWCKKCDYKCSYQSDYTRHCQTLKHAYRHNGNPGNQIGNKKRVSILALAARHSCQNQVTGSITKRV